MELCDFTRKFFDSLRVIILEVFEVTPEKCIVDLLNGPLRYEKNGIAMRLAGFALANSLSFDEDINLEKLSCIDHSKSDKSLAAIAHDSLSKLKLIILQDYYTLP